MSARAPAGGDGGPSRLDAARGPRAVLVVASALAVAVALGAGLGWLSWRFWVLGLAGLVLGLGVGWALAVMRAWLGWGSRRLLALTCVAAVLAGWGVLQVFEDAHQRAAYRIALAETRAAETGLPPDRAAEVLAAGGLDYLAAEGDSALDEQVADEVGVGGPLGRWLFRAQAGVRLAGSWREGRALPLGIPGVIIASLLEMALAVVIALRVTRRS